MNSDMPPPTDDDRAAAGCVFAIILLAMVLYSVGVSVGKFVSP